MKIVLNRNIVTGDKWDKKTNKPVAIENPTGNKNNDGKFFVKHPVNGFVEVQDGDIIIEDRGFQNVIKAKDFADNWTVVK